MTDMNQNGVEMNLNSVADLKTYILENRDRLNIERDEALVFKDLIHLFPDCNVDLIFNALRGIKRILNFNISESKEGESGLTKVKNYILEKGNIRSWKELKPIFPDVCAPVLSRAYNEVDSLKSKSDKKMVKFEYVEDKKSPHNKLKMFFDGILKLVDDKKISSFSKCISYLEVDSGIELVNGELEALRDSLMKLTDIEINGDEIRKIQVKKVVKSNGELTNLLQKADLILTNVKDQQNYFTQFKKAILDVLNPINQDVIKIKADIKDSKKEIYDKVIALKNDIFDLRTEVKFNQERINELISVCYNAINTNPNVRFKKK